MQNKVLVLAVFLSFVAMSFKGNRSPENINLIKGTYGVNNSNNSLRLVINDDNTFHYINSTNPKTPIDVKGKWELRGNAVYLKNYRSEFRINTKWKVGKDCPCLRSVKGIEFTRLCLLNK